MNEKSISTSNLEADTYRQARGSNSMSITIEFEYHKEDLTDPMSSASIDVTGITVAGHCNPQLRLSQLATMLVDREVQVFLAKVRGIMPKGVDL